MIRHTGVIGCQFHVRYGLHRVYIPSQIECNRSQNRPVPNLEEQLLISEDIYAHTDRQTPHPAGRDHYGICENIPQNPNLLHKIHKQTRLMTNLWQLIDINSVPTTNFQKTKHRLCLPSQSFQTTQRNSAFWYHIPTIGGSIFGS